MTFSILIVDDHPLMAAALAGVLRDLRPRTDCQVAASGAAARQQLARNPAIGLIVLDLGLPDTDGFRLLAYLREAHPEIAVLVVSASEDVHDMRRALAAGAAGYVAKSAPPATLLGAAADVLRGDLVVPPALVPPTRQTDGAGPTAHGLLSERQLDVLRLVCAGRSNKFIAYELGVAEKTVKGRVTAIFKALDVDNRTQAVLKAARLGLFTLRPGGQAPSAPVPMPTPPTEARPPPGD